MSNLTISTFIAHLDEDAAVKIMDIGLTSAVVLFDGDAGEWMRSYHQQFGHIPINLIESIGEDNFVVTV